MEEKNKSKTANIDLLNENLLELLDPAITEKVDFIAIAKRIKESFVKARQEALSINDNEYSQDKVGLQFGKDLFNKLTYSSAEVENEPSK
jgi:hypothetical protein